MTCNALRMFCKARSCVNLIGMINADHAAVAHKIGSLQIDRVQLATSCCRPRNDVCRGLLHGCDIVVRVENCVLSA